MSIDSKGDSTIQTQAGHSSKESGGKVDARVALLNAAKKVFAQKGYEGATVKDLADEAGLNVSLVSYHFGGKEGLYRACIVGFAEERVDAMERLLKAPETSEEFRLRLRLFGEEMTDVHIREPDLCDIIHREMDVSNPIAIEIFQSVFFRLFLGLVSFLKAAEKNKIIRKPKNYEVTTSLVFGSLVECLRSEKKRALVGHGSIKDKKFRDTFLDSWIDFVWHGVAAAKSEKSSEEGES